MENKKPDVPVPHTFDEQFIRVLSHQLKSPLNTIESILKTVTDGFAGNVDPQVKHFLDKAIGKTGEARTIIADIFDYESFASQKNLVLEEVNLSALADSLYTRYNTDAAEKNISFTVRHVPDREVIVNGNGRGLEIALRNLVENAVKYTPAGGSVTLRLTLADRNRTARVNVEDTGYGIPAADLEKIFDPFYRSAKHKLNVGGTGLGLSIVRTAFTLMNGEVSVSSEENKGTTFTASLPVHRVKEKRKDEVRRTRVVIIGGVTAGPKAAARLRRLDESLDIVIIEKSEFLSYSGCGLPAYIAGRVVSPKALMSTADNTIRDVHFFETIKNIQIMNKTEALKVDRAKKEVTVKDLATGKASSVPYDKLILATGANSVVPRIPGIKREGIYSLHKIEDAESIKKVFSDRHARDVFIIGGGLIGIETADSLLAAGARVTILEKQETILSNILDRNCALKIQSELNKKGIKVLTGVDIKRIEKDDGHFTLKTSAGDQFADLIILSAGVTSNAELGKKAGLALGNQGGIKVNEFLQTSDKDIYAIGDCAESYNILTRQQEYWPLGSISTKMGRIVADNICGRQTRFEGFIGTTMFRIIDINVARTGLTMKRAVGLGYDAATVVVTGLDKAHYLPGAEFITLKVVADKKTRKILGAQGYGRGDVVRQIGIIAMAVTKGMTLKEVFDLDLGYAPPFNHPIDIVQTACLVLTNKLDGLVKTVCLYELEDAHKEYRLVDVSPLSEHEFNALEGSLCVPLENLRSEDLPFKKDTPVVLYSKTSSRAYEAYRFLVTRGYTDLAVLEGGYVYWNR